MGTTHEEAFSRVIKLFTPSERMAARVLPDKLSGSECLIKGNKVAEEAGINKAQVISLLKKLAAAGLVATESRGSLGTTITLIWGGLPKALKKLPA